MYPRIYTRHEMTNEEYHAAPGVSKSGLWTIHTKTPAHYHARAGGPKDREALDIGTAIHTAILEPEHLESTVARGPADRRGNKWAEACSLARLGGFEVILTEKNHDMVRHIRDSAERCSVLRDLRPGLIVESSAFVDASAEQEGGLITRCRPDGYHSRAELMLDIKSTTDASASAFAASVARYGYHVQDAFYSDTWEAAGGGRVSGVIFLAFEKEPPYLIAPYELSSDTQEEGRRIYKNALHTYYTCLGNQEWPGYGDDVRTLSLPRWAMPQE